MKVNLILICLCLFTLINCNKEHKSNEFKSIVVTDNGDKFYLTDGVGKVYKKNGLKSYNFNVSHKSLHYMEAIYIHNKLENLPDDYVILSTNRDSIRPKQRITTISFYFNDQSKKQITFQDDGYANPLDRFPEQKIEPIFRESFKLIKKIRDSTKEFSDLPR